MVRAWPGSHVVVAAIVLGLLFAGCWGDIKAPPSPAESRAPTIVGRIVGWGEPNVSYLLDTGVVVDPSGTGSSASTTATLLSDHGAQWSPDRPGGLLLAGEDADGRFYAAAEFETDGCFRIRGQGYIESGQIHLSSGLILAFAPEMTRKNDRGYYDPSWLLAFDVICLDPEGRVISIHQLPLGV
ncbi:MAG TPA: hypothetical protein VGQ64_13200 [Candidatus Limnocylindrales bacterium]|nr:hypothetical protein [Candidatus Limnocylindrales bacterium]